jgi:hypothetical protein
MLNHAQKCTTITSRVALHVTKPRQFTPIERNRWGVTSHCVLQIKQALNKFQGRSHKVATDTILSSIILNGWVLLLLSTMCTKQSRSYTWQLRKCTSFFHSNVTSLTHCDLFLNLKKQHWTVHTHIRSKACFARTLLTQWQLEVLPSAPIIRTCYVASPAHTANVGASSFLWHLGLSSGSSHEPP